MLARPGSAPVRSSMAVTSRVNGSDWISMRHSSALLAPPPLFRGLDRYYMPRVSPKSPGLVGSTVDFPKALE
jgi:hypothetical protein